MFGTVHRYLVGSFVPVIGGGDRGTGLSRIYSITSSVMARSCGGNSIPSARLTFDRCLLGRRSLMHCLFLRSPPTQLVQCFPFIELAGLVDHLRRHPVRKRYVASHMMSRNSMLLMHLRKSLRREMLCHADHRRPY